MTRNPKSLFTSHKVPNWALNGVVQPSARTRAKQTVTRGDELLRIDEAASYLSVSQKTVRRLIDAGALKAIRIGRLLRIQHHEIERFVAAAASPADKPQQPTKENGYE